jgi:hypothetical protein
LKNCFGRIRPVRAEFGFGEKKKEKRGKKREKKKIGKFRSAFKFLIKLTDSSWYINNKVSPLDKSSLEYENWDKQVSAFEKNILIELVKKWNNVKPDDQIKDASQLTVNSIVDHLVKDENNNNNNKRQCLSTSVTVTSYFPPKSSSSSAFEEPF